MKDKTADPRKLTLLILKRKSPPKILCGFTNYRGESNDCYILRRPTVRGSHLEKYRRRSSHGIFSRPLDQLAMRVLLRSEAEQAS